MTENEMIASVSEMETIPVCGNGGISKWNLKYRSGFRG